MSLTTPASWLAGTREMIEASTALLLRHQAASGAFPACPTYAVYNYCWLRDGSFVAEGLSRHGQHDAAEAFHQWCARILRDRADQVAEVAASAGRGAVRDDLLLPARYTLDGHDSTEPWWNFQLDGYGTWLWALAAHLRRTGRDAAPFGTSIAVAVRYLTSLWDTPCYDWWEEHPEHQHVATYAAIDAGLRAALQTGSLDAELSAAATAAITGLTAAVSAQGIQHGHLVKWLDGTVVDGSLLACIAPFATVAGNTAHATLAAVETDLVRDSGVYRYRDDTFYGGGRWPVLTGFLGLAYVAARRVPDARAALSWIASTADGNGGLPEQVGPQLHPEREAEWVQRWGPVARPLLWSHGMYLMLADELGLRA